MTSLRRQPSRIPLRWLLIAALIAWFAYATRGILGPFIAGLVIAYLLHPLTDRLQARGLPRWLATTIMLVLFFGVFGLLIMAIAPVLLSELQQLARDLPKLIESLRAPVERIASSVDALVDIDQVMRSVTERVAGWAGEFASSILTGSLAVINILALFIMMPVVAFYALRDFDTLAARLDDLWPKRYADTIRRLMRDSDVALAGFLRGQLLVCLSLAAFYSIGWSLVGLEYGLVLGILAGVLGFVPYLGYVVSVGLALLVGFGQWGIESVNLLMVLVVFFIGQILESSMLTPNLVGNRIGLHPLWVLFAVFAGGELMGVLGVFIAVPVAAIMGVVVRWLLSEYVKSPFYGAAPPA